MSTPLFINFRSFAILVDVNHQKPYIADLQPAIRAGITLLGCCQEMDRFAPTKLFIL